MKISELFEGKAVWKPKPGDESFHNSSEEWKQGYTDAMNDKNPNLSMWDKKTQAGKKYRSGYDEGTKARKRLEQMKAEKQNENR